jgi:hypothetical protein
MLQKIKRSGIRYIITDVSEEVVDSVFRVEEIDRLFSGCLYPEARSSNVLRKKSLRYIFPEEFKLDQRR